MHEDVQWIKKSLQTNGAKIKGKAVSKHIDDMYMSIYKAGSFHF